MAAAAALMGQLLAAALMGPPFPLERMAPPKQLRPRRAVVAAHAALAAWMMMQEVVVGLASLSLAESRHSALEGSVF